VSESKQFVFLVGCPRSGTTLLQEMLNAHPQIALAPELFYIRHYVLHPERYEPLTLEEHRLQLAKDIVDAHWFPKLGWESEACRKWILNHGISHPKIYRKLLEQYSSQKNSKWIGDKTPNNVLYMSHLTTFFPGAHFIHIVRDPRAVVNSWKQVPWSTGTRTGDAKIWEKYTQAAFRISPDLKPLIYTVRYEDLIASPKGELTRICQFLSLDYSDEMEKYRQKETSFESQIEPWKSNAKNPVDLKRIYRWKTELNNKEIAAIESIVASSMVNWGYQPLSPKYLRILFWPFRFLFPYWTFFLRKLKK